MIELKNIHRIIVFTSNPETKTTLYFDYIRLTREL